MAWKTYIHVSENEPTGTFPQPGGGQGSWDKTPFTIDPPVPGDGGKMPAPATTQNGVSPEGERFILQIVGLEKKYAQYQGILGGASFRCVDWTYEFQRTYPISDDEPPTDCHLHYLSTIQPGTHPVYHPIFPCRRDCWNCHAASLCLSSMIHPSSLYFYTDSLGGVFCPGMSVDVWERIEAEKLKHIGEEFTYNEWNYAYEYGVIFLGRVIGGGLFPLYQGFTGAFCATAGSQSSGSGGAMGLFAMAGAMAGFVGVSSASATAAGRVLKQADNEESFEFNGEL